MGKQEGRRTIFKISCQIGWFFGPAFAAGKFFGFFQNFPQKPIDKGVKCKYNAYKPT